MKQSGANNMSDEIVEFNDVNTYTGMRALLVKRAGEPVDVAKWLEIVPEDLRGSAVWDQYQMNQGTFVWHHLRMDWMTREFIRFEADDSRLASIEGWKQTVNFVGGTDIPAVAWMLKSGDRVSGAIRSASELYWGTISRWPKLCLVRSMPTNAPKEIVIDPSSGGVVKIVQVDWMWRKMVVVL